MGDDNKKFLFNLNNFDTDQDEEKKKPKEPTFSLKDMEDARNSAFEKGKAEGTQIAKDSIEQRTEILVQSLAQNITTLEQSERKRREQCIQDALVMTYKTLQTLIPSLSQTLATEDIHRYLTEFFEGAVMKSGFKLTVHPEMVEAITPHAQTINADIDIQSDPSLPPSNAEISWSDGHSTWNPDAINAKILEMIKVHISDPKSLEAELLDESAKNPHNEGETLTSGPTPDSEGKETQNE